MKKKLQKNPPENSSLFWEGRVASTLGVSRTTLRGLRGQHLTEGEHFTKEAGSVVLTTAGLELITKLVGSSAATDTPPTPPGPPERVKLIVMRVVRNPHLLVCIDPGDVKQKQYLVRVRTNENFMPRMELEAVSAGAGLWQYTGRLPRKKGHWL